MTLLVGSQHPLAVERAAGAEKATDQAAERLFARAEVAAENAEEDAGRLGVTAELPKREAEVVEEVASEILRMMSGCPQ